MISAKGCAKKCVLNFLEKFLSLLGSSDLTSYVLNLIII